MQHKYLYRVFLYIVCLPLLSFSAAWADSVELASGTSYTGVITEETESTITIRLEIGTITLDKKTITVIQRSRGEDNNRLLAEWRNAKKAYKERLRHDSDVTNVPIRKGERRIRYESRWITQDEYNTILAQTRAAEESHLTEEKKRLESELLEQEWHEQRAKTLEIVRQGQKKRSQLGNLLLENNTWLHRQISHATLFFTDPRLAPLAKTLGEKIPAVYNRIIDHLALEQEFLLDEAIEIYLINDASSWDTIAQYHASAETPKVYATYYHKEVYLYVGNSRAAWESLIAHQFAHIILRAYVHKDLSKKHQIPLWLEEGFAQHISPLSVFTIPTSDIAALMRTNAYIRLNELLALPERPTEPLRQRLFYVESMQLVRFVYNYYGSERFNEFIHRVIETYHSAGIQPAAIRTDDAKKIMRDIINNSFLRTDFAGYASFEEAWMRHMAN